MSTAIELTTAEALEIYQICLWRPDDLIEVRPLPVGSGLRRWIRAGDLPGLADELTRENKAGANLYGGVLPRAGERGADADCLPGWAAWADFDNAAPVDALAHAEAAGLPVPTLVVNSGHGAHLFWGLEAPASPAELSALVGDIAILIGSDRTVRNPSRILRLPGFQNHKPPAARCEIFRQNISERYTFGELRALVPAAPPAPPAPVVAAGPVAEGREHLLRRATAYAAAVPGVGEGGRNAEAFKVAAKLQRGFDLSDAEAWPLFSEWNGRNGPPLPEREARDVFKSGAKYGTHPPGELAAQPPPAQPLPAQVRPAVKAAEAPSPEPDPRPIFTSIADELEKPDALEKPERLATGIHAVDAATGGGFVQGGLTLIAGRTTTGKSSFFRALAVGMLPHGVAFTTLEDAGAACRRGLCSIYGGGDVEEGRRRFLEDRPLLRMNYETADLEALVRANEDRARLDGIGVSLVDQLSWLHSDVVSGDTYREASRVAQELKLLAKRTGLVVVAAVQVNRAGASADRNGERLALHHLRDSGRLEESADAVLIVQSLDGETGEMQIDLAKNRQGRRELTFAVRLDFATGQILPVDGGAPKTTPKRGRPAREAVAELTFEQVRGLLTPEPQSTAKLVLRLQGQEIPKHAAETLVGDVRDRLGGDSLSGTSWQTVAGGLFQIKRERNGWRWRLPPKGAPDAL